MDKINPVVTQAAFATAIIVVVKSVVQYFKVMGWINLGEVEAAATVSFAETIIPILVVWGGALWSMRKVTSLSNPKDSDGAELSRPGDLPVIAKIEEAIKINEKIDEKKAKKDLDERSIER